MEKRRSNQIVGIVLLGVGLYWALQSLDFIHFNIFFPGWWTLFIIVPSLAGISSGKSRGSSIAGLALGVMLLLWQLRIIPGALIPGVFVALIFIFIGISIMCGGTKKKERTKSQTYEYTYEGAKEKDSKKWTSYEYTNTQYSYHGADQPKESARDAGYENADREAETGWTQQGGSQSDSGYTQRTGYQSNQSTYETCPPHISALLVGKSVTCLRGVFHGTSVQSILGNVQLDLRQAVLEHDVAVNVNLLLGGADIYLPENARVICEAQSILGEVRDVRKSVQDLSMNGPVIRITGSCILGGLELK